MKKLITIRKFQPDDFASVIEIEQKVFNEHDPFYYMKFYETCSEGFLVAEVNSIVAGFVVGYRVSEDIGRIFSLGVDPGYQNMGIGSALLKEINLRLNLSRVSEIVLEVRQSNVRAKRFYERQGFYVSGITERYYYDGENAYIMKLKLY
ncbi:MAG: ribosomal protein S18-alanine N-acetyltransferase [Candidatus Methanoperedens sp.]|nr:ribosomal protein S18-alanine N-acetyltransferase [Candidatus Methanoperedens sp.]PKL52994.1 MAG: ribosomal-protein-alanine N-acetyltransferase [Candidatus Methanoperedenaceae archaeon HGW-Methanoperedenaceae-1]